MIPRTPTTLTKPRLRAGGSTARRLLVGSDLVGHGVLLAGSCACATHASAAPRTSGRGARRACRCGAQAGELARDLDPQVELRGRGAAVDRRRSRHPSPRRGARGSGAAPAPASWKSRYDDDAGGGVQQHDVAHRALLAVEHPAHDRGVVRGVAAQQIVDVGERDAEIARIEVVLVDVAPADLPHAAVTGRGQLVESVVAAEDERRRAARAEHAGDQRHAVEAARRRPRSPRRAPGCTAARGS